MSSRGKSDSSSVKISPVITKLSYRRKVSVHFGVSKYTYWGTLKNAAGDATALAERFQLALNFDQSTVILDEEVTKERIETVFKDLSKCSRSD